MGENAAVRFFNFADEWGLRNCPAMTRSVGFVRTRFMAFCCALGFFFIKFAMYGKKCLCGGEVRLEIQVILYCY